MTHKNALKLERYRFNFIAHENAEIIEIIYISVVPIVKFYFFFSISGLGTT